MRGGGCKGWGRCEEGRGGRSAGNGLRGGGGARTEMGSWTASPRPQPRGGRRGESGGGEREGETREK